MRTKSLLLLIIALLTGAVAAAQTVSGTVTDAATGETLIGATVFDTLSRKGTLTNVHGRFSLTTGGRTAVVRVAFTGYKPQTFALDLGSDRSLNVALSPTLELDAVVVTAERVGSVQVSQMSAIEVPVEQIRLVPVIFGEGDVLKAIQLLPGVQAGSEGTSGIYVRGGGMDENLFLLDGVPLYNVNHLGGFFSAFNNDAIKNVTLYKGSFPARFAGRISSVLDIATNNGNAHEWHGGASIGAIAAKAYVEGPLWRDRTTLSLSARRTYGDLLIQPLLRIASLDEDMSFNAGYYFYDINAKVTHRVSDRSQLYAGFYAGDDVVYLRTLFDENDYYSYRTRDYMKLGYNWGNLLASLRWNYVVNSRLFFNLTGSYTRYRNDLGLGIEMDYHDGADFSEESLSTDYRSGIRDLALRADFDYTPAPEHAVRFGSAVTNHHFTPAVSGMRMQYSDLDTAFRQDTILGESTVDAQEFVLYAEDDWSVTPAFKVNAGLALAGFLVQGRFYPSLQPRLSARLMLTDDLSLKVGYSYMTQYMHLLSTSNVSLPTDLWVPVTKRIAPSTSHQVAAGLFYNLLGLVDLSLEGYGKWMDNLMEYRTGSTFFSNSTNWEDKVCLGRGWAYGVELLAQRTVGSVTGWLGYTWSRTIRQFDELNAGRPFPAKYDRIHDLSLSLQYRPNDRFDAGLTWVYSTGNTATLALQQFQAEGSGDGYSFDNAVGYVDSRNNYRLPAYHRLDLSVNFHKRLKRGVRTWNISVYNAYNRQNPFIIYRSGSHSYTAPDGTRYASALVQRSLFPIIPSVAFIYKF